jgi:DNA polymerase (family 10)
VSIADALGALADLAGICGRQRERDTLAGAAADFDVRRPTAVEASAASPFSSLGLDAAVLEALGDAASLTPAAAVERAVASLPRDLRRLLGVPGLSIRELARLVNASGMTTFGELSRWLEAPGPAPQGTVPDALRQPLSESLAYLRSPSERIALGRAFEVAATLTAELMALQGPFERVEAVGSLRRFDATVGDITLLAASHDPPAAVARLRNWDSGYPVKLHRADRVTVQCRDHEATILIVAPAVFGRALMECTGSKAHLLALTAHAFLNGRRLDFTEWRGLDPPAMSEEAIYETLGLPFIEPELREGAGEVEAAVEGRLPRLVTRGDMRGDLHVHTTWSDGRDSVETMARRARALGYEFLAVTDHSPATVTRGIDEEGLRRQADEIARVQELTPGLTILRGVEVDILPSGRLDLRDEALESLDLVLASLHDPAGHSPRRLTSRYLAALRHPLVHVITHPANRVVGLHAGYAIDFDRLLAAAHETGTALEIDGAPVHLDMDGALARRAVRAGVTVTIDSDCHWAERLDRQMTFGVATARRGWVEAADVINTRPLDELRAWLGRKRS